MSFQIGNPVSEPWIDIKNIKEIKKEISRRGHYSYSKEWRAFTYADVEIKKIEKDSHSFTYMKGFNIKISNGADIDFYSPTLERAIFYANIYLEITKDCFYEYGWPSNRR